MTDREIIRARYNLRSAVRNIIPRIRGRRFSFAVEWKHGSQGAPERVTAVDREMEEAYRRHFSQAFPGVPIIGEEDGVAWSGPAPETYITVDPIDGTDAFCRKESAGIGTMVAMVSGGRVVAAAIGDVMTGEIYDMPALREGVERLEPSWPGDPKTVALSIDPAMTLKKQYALCGMRESRYPERVRQFIANTEDGGLFHGINIDSGSIGLRAARLWKGSVGALVMKPRKMTPWDDTPVIGLSKSLGFVFLRLGPDGRFQEFEPEISPVPVPMNHETIIIHRSRLDELREWEATH